LDSFHIQHKSRLKQGVGETLAIKCRDIVENAPVPACNRSWSEKYFRPIGKYLEPIAAS
jgi:hypothetical protein